MLQKKICMLGAFAVGKTSLVSRFVKSMFSERYQTTVGVKIDKKLMDIDGQQLNLMLWDLHGEDDYQKVRPSYLRGSAGYLLVVDGTRPATLETVIYLQEMASGVVGDAPFIVLLNKADLKEEWSLPTEACEALRERGWPLIYTSAKSGEGVEEAFDTLARNMVK